MSNICQNFDVWIQVEQQKRDAIANATAVFMRHSYQQIVLQMRGAKMGFTSGSSPQNDELMTFLISFLMTFAAQFSKMAAEIDGCSENSKFTAKFQQNSITLSNPRISMKFW